MKKLLFSLCSLLLVASGFSQQKEGTITYEKKVNLHRMIPDEQMRAMVPEFRSTKHMLYFSDSVSLFKLLPEDEAMDPFGGGGGGGFATRMIARFGADGGDLYKNFAQAKSIQANELGGKNFLILDTIKPQPWKMSMETKQILGYNCHKASRKMTVPNFMARRRNFDGSMPDTTKVPTSKEVELVAWFADQILSPVGPESYGQLPGVILELNVDNGATVFTAKEIKTSVDAKELKEPKKGKVVSQQEYSKLQRDLMSNMGGGGGQIRVFRAEAN